MTNKSELLEKLKIDKSPIKPQRSAIWVKAGATLGIVAAIVVATGYYGEKSDVLLIKTALAKVQKFTPQQAEQITLQASGYVTARRKATVSSKITGKIVEVLVEEGDIVEQNQIVAKLDNSNAHNQFLLSQFQLQTSKAQVNETAELLKEAKKSLQRKKETAQHLSQAELDSSEVSFNSLNAQLQTRKAEVITAEQRVQIQRQNLEDLIIRAPFAGVVVTKNAQPGEMISPVSAGGGFTRTGICGLVDMSSLEIEVDVNETFIDKITPGQPVHATLHAYKNWKIPAKVIAIVPTANRQKSTVKVRIAFDELDPRILPDMGVKVAILNAMSATTNKNSKLESGILVPSSAIINKDGQVLIYIADKGIARQRVISTKVQAHNKLLITSGLSAGDNYVVDIPKTLYDGAAISITN